MTPITKKDFVRILKKFADSPADVLEDREVVTCSINGELISVSLMEKDDVLMCVEDGRILKARIWLEKRVAKLDMLCKKIIDIIGVDSHFVDVGAKYEGVDAESIQETSVTDSILGKLAQNSNYATEVLYLLSEAGDGKSAIMNRVAVKSAQKYYDTGVGPIVLPISLDGRPFLRIDDLVIGILANQFRFRYFYFEGLLELVKMGSVVLGLDGFEEMVVEGKEEHVISSLGELLKSFESSGRVMISARRAFYEYALKKQLPLLDSIQSLQVDCNAYRLLQWKRQEFEQLLTTYPKLRDKKCVIYDNLVEKLGEDNPILIRPVLARKLVDALGAIDINDENLGNIASGLTTDKDPQSVMREFVAFLVQREANLKWLSTSGPTQGVQILSAEEHMQVLRAIAEDMWLSSVEYVKQEYLQDWMGLVCGELNKSPSETRDAREKILHHAVLVRDNDRYGFCHDAFRKYFLGQDIARYIIDEDGAYTFERILAQDVIDSSIASVVSYELSLSNIPYENVAKFLQSVKAGASKLSPIGQNVGTILLSYAQYAQPSTKIILSDLFVTKAAAVGRYLNHVRFEKCLFEAFDCSKIDAMEDVELCKCTLISIILRDPRQKMCGLCIDEESLPQSIVFSDGSSEDELNIEYSPTRVYDVLQSVGVLKCQVEGIRQNSVCLDKDEVMSTLLSLSMVLKRTSGLSDRALEVRFGKRWHKVNDEMLPIYIADGVLCKREWYGGGGKERYSLNVPMSKFELARNKCNGQYVDFVKALKTL